MNYLALKGMMETIVKSFKCPSCSDVVGEENIDIVGAAGTTANLDVVCPKCDKHSMIKIDMVSLDLGTLNINEQQLAKLKDGISGLKAKTIAPTNKKLIKDEEIINLNKDLRKMKLSASELFGEGEDKSS